MTSPSSLLSSVAISQCYHGMPACHLLCAFTVGWGEHVHLMNVDNLEAFTAATAASHYLVATRPKLPLPRLRTQKTTTNVPTLKSTIIMVKKVTNTSVRNTRTGASQHPQQAQKERQEQVNALPLSFAVPFSQRISKDVLSLPCCSRGAFSHSPHLAQTHVRASISIHLCVHRGRS